jgi:hypothetical protein
LIAARKVPDGASSEITSGEGLPALASDAAPEFEPGTAHPAKTKAHSAPIPSKAARLRKRVPERRVEAEGKESWNICLVSYDLLSKWQKRLSPI